MADDLKLKQFIKEQNEETRRHFDVVAEHIEDKIKLAAEQVAANTEKLQEHDERFNRLDQRLNQIEETLTTIKLDIEFIKNDLAQKVPRQEFAALERRVSLLENKLAR